ncbi:MAG: endopeptidase La [Gammaproteobacteria bacterium]|nr:endopeptidase La [Gammaproteobacteria bacterium]
MSERPSEANRISVLPLRDVVVYPHMVMSLFVGRAPSIRALEESIESDSPILLLAQRSPEVDEPKAKDLFRVGTLATILQMLKLPDGTMKLLVEGQERMAVQRLYRGDSFTADAAGVAEHAQAPGQENDALQRAATASFEQYVRLSKKVPAELLGSLAGIEESGRLADAMAAHMNLRLEDRQSLLEEFDPSTRLEKIMALVSGEIDLLQMENRIHGRVKQQMEKSQREYYLNEQMKAIQKEMGETGEGPGDLDELAQRIEAAGMSKEARKKADAELAKLRMMPPMAAEATVVRNYLDWLLGVPWKKRSRVRSDLSAAQEVLQRDHFGLEKVKERVVEYLAVQKRVRHMKGPILCLVGPPGVGKTSLGQSIARATNRKFCRISLGGVRDEAEIRGHRRTYIGSMPGKIIQKLARAGTRNPLMVLDEIDKMSMDFRGDPSSALLEVLDPEQNNVFNDHYLEVDFDLSEVLFIATANSLNIPPPLRDRMEIIRIPGYTEDEKKMIARHFLVPKQIKANGLKAKEIEITDEAIEGIIRVYTREAGVRNLEREIARICRKTVKSLLLDAKGGAPIRIGREALNELLGVERFRFGRADEENQVGQVVGLAWTEVGGELLRIEAASVPGKGKLTHTGQLGDVMKESVQAALTVVRARAPSLGIGEEAFREHDFHVHVPEGATPKDGPSAGIGMATALVSALTGIAVRAEVAMTGEITLRGEILPIGGLKEKLLAAQRGGISTVLIPEENVKDLADIPDNVKNGLDIVPVRRIDAALNLALVREPEPLPETRPIPPDAPRSGRGAIPAH